MADNFNITGAPLPEVEEAGGLEANNPAMTYVDFANQMAKNSQAQQEQAALVQQAQANARTSTLGATQKEAAAAMGVNPELKDFLPINEAIAELKAAGVDDDTINEFVKSLGNQNIVNRAAIDTIIRKKQLSIKLTGQGKNYKTSDDIPLPAGMTAEDLGLVADEDNPKVGHVPSDGVYQVAVDPTSGEILKFIPGGETPPPNANIALKESEADEKQWQKLDTEINKYTRSTRGNSLVQAVQRATRALNELTNGQPLTPQVLGFIHDDISGIFQGGVPPVTGKDATSFLTVKDNINRFLGRYTGRFNLFQGDIGTQRQYITGLVTRLLISTENMLNADIKSEQAGYQSIIQKDPSRWNQMVQDKTGISLSGLEPGAAKEVATEQQSLTPPATAPTQTGGTASMQPAPANPNIDALAAALGLQKKAQ